MIVVELIKMIRRPRTWLIIGMLVALPTLVAILLAATHFPKIFLSISKTLLASK